MMQAIEATHWLSPAQLAGYAAFAFGMLSFVQTDDRRFKIFMAMECAACVLHFALLGPYTAVASTLLWLVNNLLVGSVGGSLLDACLLVANLWTIRRLWRAR